ncbi:MAG: polysaccharide deacetylase family protein [Acidobacteria bacterium]|nr:polysaccharide deacetylase family protein [Acidobacteriota bacterium]
MPRPVSTLLAIVCVLCIFGSPSRSMAADNKPDRQVAITIDDLPAGSNVLSAAAITEMTTKLLTTLHDQKIPVVGFVNEKKIYKPGEADQRIAALRMWLDFGFELGNHTYSHASLNKVGLKAWEDEVIQGESVTTLLLAEHKMKMRYFRHPYLDTGRDLLTRREADAFLTARGYHIAPITLDAWDWAYAAVYEDAKRRGDTAAQDELAKSYLAYSDASFAYSEQLSKQIVGYEPKQIILLHANQLEADHIGELLDLFRKRGYRFITLEDALSDGAYSLPDTYVGEGGTGWIEHWAISQGKIPQGAPPFPQAVIDKWKVLAPTQP